MSLLSGQLQAVAKAMPYRVGGSVVTVAGLTIEAADLNLPLGAMCRIRTLSSGDCAAEVIGFQSERTLLMPLSTPTGVARGDRIESMAAAPLVECSGHLLGRVLNGFALPIDGLGPLPLGEARRLDGHSPLPMDRDHINAPIATSVRAIDGLHTCGLGQRMGIFSGPGVGKSMLLSQIARYTSADVSVVALVGERGREVQEFIEKSLGAEGRAKCVLVVSIGDEPALLKVRAVKVACTIAEYFRDCGKNVLLLVDSLTRLAQAQRQIGLAAREPPATKGFPPSVFALLPEILERAGKTAVGSITGFYTVLVEGDDFNEPIPDAVKGITDGHLLLSRSLASKGHFPAIDPIQSISRVRGDVAPPEQVKAAQKVLALYAQYQEVEDLINIGAYVPGANPAVDLAVQTRPRVVAFLKQEPGMPLKLEESRKALVDLAGFIEQTERQLMAAAGRKPGAQAAGVGR